MASDLKLFISALQARLDAGARAYGDASFSRSPAELLVELEQEALDLAGWGYVLWRRLQVTKDAVASLAEPTGSAPVGTSYPNVTITLDPPLSKEDTARHQRNLSAAAAAALLRIKENKS